MIVLADHPALSLLPECPTEAQMQAFGEFLQSLEATHAAPDLSTRRHVAEGIEGRSVVIKAETFLVGLPHKLGGLAVCVGDITVWTTSGRQRYTGAHILQTSRAATESASRTPTPHG